MEKYEIGYPKLPKVLVVIVFIVFVVLLSFLIYQIFLDESLYDAFRVKLQIAQGFFAMLVAMIAGLYTFRTKITVEGDKITVRKVFKITEYSLNKLYKISVETRYGRKPKSNITLYKEKHVYFSFGEDMVNANRLIDTLVRRCLIERKPDGSYESNRQ